VFRVSRTRARDAYVALSGRHPVLLSRHTCSGGGSDAPVVLRCPGAAPAPADDRANQRPRQEKEEDRQLQTKTYLRSVARRIRAQTTAALQRITAHSCKSSSAEQGRADYWIEGPTMNHSSVRVRAWSRPMQQRQLPCCRRATRALCAGQPTTGACA